MTTPDLFEPAGADPAERFEPTLAAARARLAAVQPAAYARTRNHLQGAVTRLSPYLTHGLLTLREVVSHLRHHHGLDLQHKLVQELGWRAWWHHAWRHRGEAIFDSLHAGPMPEHAYARELPADIRQARTGVPMIDQAVRTLHAHLLDGDLASNHLSWQWIAGTGSHQPYLFNADNVARYAPSPWHSFGSVIDTSYERLGDRAAGGPLPAAARQPARAVAGPVDGSTLPEPAVSACRPGVTLPVPDAAAFAGRDVWLLHPWALDGPPPDLPEGTLVAGLWLDDHHARWPWSPARWDFVGARLDALAHAQWRGTAAQWRAALAGAARVRGWNDPNLGGLGSELGLPARPPAFIEPDRPCRSFSQFWRAVSLAV